jgi:Rrf2 family nitric oxide-sensitive transcriptional repressor
MHRPCLLMYLALKDDGLATIAEIAESYGISKNHLMKVAHQLGVAGYVATVRGRSGGLRLAKPAEAALLSVAPGHVPAPAGMRSPKRAKAGRQG